MLIERVGELVDAVLAYGYNFLELLCLHHTSGKCLQKAPDGKVSVEVHNL